MQYETKRTYNAGSWGAAYVDLTILNNSNCRPTFTLSAKKVKGDKKEVCVDVSCLSDLSQIQTVRIRSDTTDGWGIEGIRVYKYLDSSNYQMYSLDGINPSFWIDKNTNGYYDYLPSCTDGEWCQLHMIGGKLNNLFILLRATFKSYTR